MKKRKPPTMTDVARDVGVSTMTVSRAFRDDASVSGPTRDKIRAAAERLGYVLDSTAAVLSSRRTGFVAVTIPSINNANFAETVHGLSERLREARLEILLGYTDYDQQEEERLIEQFLRRRPEAIVVTGGTHTERGRRLLANAGVPVVEIWDLPPTPIGHVVGFSNAAAARLMVDHFVARGYRRIAFAGGDTRRDARGLERRRGFIAALVEHGLAADRLVGSGPPPISMGGGAAAMAEVLTRWPDTEAVMCVSDLAAFGALTECQRRGLRVPDDIAIAGFGAYDIAEYAVPSITTIDVAARDIGRLAGDTVIRVLGTGAAAGGGAGGVGSGSRVVTRIEPRLIVRATTGPAVRAGAGDDADGGGHG
jgi:LacI family gluconate utilization system Gnt-I transcriptional repressor